MLLCGWAHNWNAIIKSSSLSQSHVFWCSLLWCSGTTIWCACFGLPLWYSYSWECAGLVKHIFVECPILVQCLHWYFLARQLNPCACGESPHLVHWFGFLAEGKGVCWFTCLCCWGCCHLVPVLGYGLLLPFFFLGSRLVWLCCKTFTWVAPCILDVCCLMCLAVALLDSSFLAICHTLAAGYCSSLVLPSLIVLAINSLSTMKSQKMFLVRIAAVSSGYSHNGICANTALYHLSMLLLPCQKVVNKSNSYTDCIRLWLAKIFKLWPYGL